MIKENISLKETVDFLNSLLKIDKIGVSKLFYNREHCNKELANHPTVQVGMLENEYVVGILGVLNGLFGNHEDGYGAIAMVVDDLNLIEKFEITSEVRDK